MKNSIGTSVILTLWGESHGEAIGVVLDGLAPGLRVDRGFIAAQLEKRSPQGKLETARVEKDDFQIVSGEKNGFSTGSPLLITIPNHNRRSADYDDISQLPRPSHADYAAQMKYHGFQDKSGGGHFSGRVTAGIVAAGAICLQALENKGIFIGTHILSCAGVADENLLVCLDNTALVEKIRVINSKSFPVLDEVQTQMCAKIDSARQDNDSVGGVVQTAVVGLPAGIGEPCFDSLEGVLSKALFAIGGIKGLEFGAGFGLADMRGSVANDAFYMQGDNVRTSSNNSGGINGGISNGMPLIFNSAVRPTPSIARVQQTVDISARENVQIEIKGRHDPAIVRRICVVVSSMTALVLCDMLAQRYGTDWIVTE